MAKIKKADYERGQFGGASPFGNGTVLEFHLTTNAKGALEQSNSTTALASGDVIDIGELPQGFCPYDALIFVHTGMTASMTAKLGFQYADGQDDSDVPQDDALLFSTANLATPARLRSDGKKLLTLPKTARLILTLAGATNNKVSDIRIVIMGELKGR